MAIPMPSATTRARPVSNRRLSVPRWRRARPVSTRLGSGPSVGPVMPVTVIVSLAGCHGLHAVAAVRGDADPEDDAAHARDDVPRGVPTAPRLALRRRVLRRFVLCLLGELRLKLRRVRLPLCGLPALILRLELRGDCPADHASGRRSPAAGSRAAPRSPLTAPSGPPLASAARLARDTPFDR